MSAILNHPLSAPSNNITLTDTEKQLYILGNASLPWYALIPFKFEASFDRQAAHLWMKTYWTTSFYYIAIYLITLVVLSKWMQNRKRFELKGLLVLWNLGLAVFSVFGTLRLAPELVRIVSVENGYHDSICDTRSLYSPAALFWGWLFGLSKVVELGDTIFIVLRKRPLTFLHVFHHCTVLVACWYTGTQVAPTARWFVTMNYTVHSVMYTYYALQILRWFSIPKIVAMSITVLQIAQMVGIFMTNLYAFQVKQEGKPCDQSDGAINLIGSLSLAYLSLFLWFFYNAYLRKKVKMT